MKRELRNKIFAMLTAALVVFATGCQTLQPAGIEMESLASYGGGGGGDN